MPKPLPEFQSEDEEREFWANEDSTEYLDWSQAKRAVFPSLKPSTKTISLRMSEAMLNELTLLANKQDGPVADQDFFAGTDRSGVVSATGGVGRG
ncbi:MAG TPA: BrnA antitoxin family protein [Anaerolineales bacterium]|nr:BrnA antitoxin family protein [Anaerolineales bacterium]